MLSATVVALLLIVLVGAWALYKFYKKYLNYESWSRDSIASLRKKIPPQELFSCWDCGSVFEKGKLQEVRYRLTNVVEGSSWARCGHPISRVDNFPRNFSRFFCPEHSKDYDLVTGKYHIEEGREDYEYYKVHPKTVEKVGDHETA